MGPTRGIAALPKDDPKDEPSEPLGWKGDTLPKWAEGTEEGAGIDNPESRDSTELEGPLSVFTSGTESKFAQLLLLDAASCTEDAFPAACGCWIVTGGSGTASKSINEASTFISDGFASEDAKLLEDAVLCKRNILPLALFDKRI